MNHKLHNRHVQCGIVLVDVTRFPNHYITKNANHCTVYIYMSLTIGIIFYMNHQANFGTSLENTQLEKNGFTNGFSFLRMTRHTIMQNKYITVN